MPVLSQMILANVAEERAALWLEVKTPGFWYQNLKCSEIRQQKWITLSHEGHITLGGLNKIK